MLTVPALLPSGLAFSNSSTGENKDEPMEVRFNGDGRYFPPSEYLKALAQFDSMNPIRSDVYGNGGAVEALESKFAELTGKESAIYMPTGTMANQFAVYLLSGDKTKIIVQETSHMFRDEADAAQTVFSKRLVPLAAGQTYFTAKELEIAVSEISNGEVFQTGIGALSIENPVRRTMGGTVPLDEIKRISDFCKAHSIKLHLDGARIFLACAWQGVSLQEYTRHFDTVYISLYKYLGASGGAILCGDKAVIGKMPNLIKVHGGNMYGNWTNAAMALNRLNGIEQRFAETVKRTALLVNGLNATGKFNVSGITGGTNIYNMKFTREVDTLKLKDKLERDFRIIVRAQKESNELNLSMNETILNRDANYIVDAFARSV